MFSSNVYGSYGGGPGAYASAYGGLPVANISFETNSKDPFLQRARVFVGNIMTSKVGRDEIIQLFSSYGKLLGVTVFKGYAFVQFSYGTEADLAVSALNGYNWHGGTLDVKLAMHGQQQPPTPVAPPAPPKSIFGAFQTTSVKSTVKRNKNEVPLQEAAAKDLKRMKIDQGSAGATAVGDGTTRSADVPAKNNANRTFAAQPDGAISNTTSHGHDEILDTLICGGCRFVTHCLADFVEHRKRPCKIAVAKTAAGEPGVLGCISCDEHFESSWALLSHHNSAHIRPLFKEIVVSGNSASASSSATTNGGEKRRIGGGGGGTGTPGGGGTVKPEDMDEPMMMTTTITAATAGAGQQLQQKTCVDLADELIGMAVSIMRSESNEIEYLSTSDDAKSQSDF